MATRRAPLRAVGPDEPAPAPTKPKTVTEAADSGTTRELLVAMRARIAKAVEDPSCPPRDLASLSRRLHELSKDIEQHDAVEAQEEGRRGEVADEDFDSAAI